jgi:monothiol glutaredoxin
MNEATEISAEQVQAIVDEIKAEIAEHKILVYSKGTKENPRCGFTMETVAFLTELGRPFHMIDALEQPIKRQVLNQMFDWQTLPKIFINGEFYGDTDILNEMKANGELQPIVDAAFA